MEKFQLSGNSESKESCMEGAVPLPLPPPYPPAPPLLPAKACLNPSRVGVQGGGWT